MRRELGAPQPKPTESTPGTSLLQKKKGQHHTLLARASTSATTRSKIPTVLRWFPARLPGSARRSRANPTPGACGQGNSGPTVGAASPRVTHASTGPRAERKSDGAHAMGWGGVAWLQKAPAGDRTPASPRRDPSGAGGGNQAWPSQGAEPHPHRSREWILLFNPDHLKKKSGNFAGTATWTHRDRCPRIFPSGPPIARLGSTGSGLGEDKVHRARTNWFDRSSCGIVSFGLLRAPHGLLCFAVAFREPRKQASTGRQAGVHVGKRRAL